jgi:hypothetical protein
MHFSTFPKLFVLGVKIGEDNDVTEVETFFVITL